MSGPRVMGDGGGDGAAGVAVRDIARHIRRMALLVRGAELMSAREGRPVPGRALARRAVPEAKAAGPELGAEPGAETGAESGVGPGWWVLAQGGRLNEDDFAQREAVREELLGAVRLAGILLDENVWVWDESGRAQLVLSTLPTLERARRVALRLRGKGLSILVRREQG